MITSSTQKPAPNHFTNFAGLGAVLLAILFAVRAAFEIIIHGDLWWGLSAGRFLRTEGTIPRTDPFSFTALGDEWINPEWSTHWLTYTLYDAFGESALFLLRLGLILVIFGLVFHLARRRSSSTVIAGLATAFGAWVCVPFLDLRPQLLTFIYATVFLIVLHRFRWGGRNLLFALPILQILWTNGHAGYVLGPVLVLGTALAETAKRLVPLPGTRLSWRRVRLLWIVVPFTAVATLVNPLTYRIYLASLDMSQLFARDPVFFEVLEWYPPPFFETAVFSPVQFWCFLFSAGALVLLAALVNRRSPDITDIGLSVALAGFLALQHRRFIPLFTLVTVPLLAYSFAVLLARVSGRSSEPLSPPGRRTGIALGVATWIALIAVLPIQARSVADRAKRTDSEGASIFRINTAYNTFPVDAVQFMKETGVPGPLFNRYQWGGYLSYFLPETPVFIDGRAQQVYSGDTFRDYRIIKNADPSWEGRIEQYGVRSILIDSRSSSPLFGHLRSDPAWVWIYGDEVAYLFVRDTHETTPFLSRYRARTLPLPESTTTYIAYADDAWGRGDREQALADLKHATTLAGDDVSVHVYYISVLLAAERVPEAMQAVRIAIDRYPDEVGPRFAQAQVAVATGDPRTAYTLCEDVLRRLADHIPTLQMMHSLSPTEAAALVEKEMSENPKDPAWIFAAGTLAELRRDPAAALRYYNQSAEIAAEIGDDSRVQRARIAKKRLTGR